MNSELVNSVNESISLKRGLINSTKIIKQIENLIFNVLKKKKNINLWKWGLCCRCSTLSC